MIYNATHYNWSWLPRIYCIRHGDYYSTPAAVHQWRPITRDDMRYALDRIPLGADIQHDVEGSLVPETLESWPELRNWHPRSQLSTAYVRRANMMQYTLDQRPDLKQGFWPMPQEEQYNNIARTCDHVYIEAYPWSWDTERSWKNKLIRKIGKCYDQLQRIPRVMITDKTEDAQWSLFEFEDRLDHLMSFNVDVVYWCMRKESPSWGVKWALVKRSW